MFRFSSCIMYSPVATLPSRRGRGGGSSLANALAPLEREEIKRVSAFPLPCHVSHLLHSSMSHVNEVHFLACSRCITRKTSLLCPTSHRLTFLVPRRASWLSHGLAMRTNDQEQIARHRETGGVTSGASSSLQGTTPVTVAVSFSYVMNR